MRKQLWFGCVVCSLAVVPGLVIGAVVSLVVSFLNSFQMDPNADFLFLGALFGIKAPGIILNYIVFRLAPIVLQGGVAGGFAIWVATKLYLEGQVEIVAYLTGALYTGIVIALAIVLFVVRPPVDASIGVLEEGCRLLGIWIGLLAIAESEGATRRQQLKMSLKSAKPS